MEQGLWFVIIVLNDPVTDLVKAVMAVGLVLVAGAVIGVIHMDNSPADGAGKVPAVIAMLAQGCCVIPGVFVPPDTGAAVGADHRGTSQTVRAEQLSVEFDHLIFRIGYAAGFTGLTSLIGSHKSYLHKLN